MILGQTLKRVDARPSGPPVPHWPSIHRAFLVALVQQIRLRRLGLPLRSFRLPPCSSRLPVRHHSRATPRAAARPGRPARSPDSGSSCSRTPHHSPSPGPRQSPPHRHLARPRSRPSSDQAKCSATHPRGHAQAPLVHSDTRPQARPATPRTLAPKSNSLFFIPPRVPVARARGGAALPLRSPLSIVQMEGPRRATARRHTWSQG